MELGELPFRLKTEQTQDIAEKIINHRNNFVQIMNNRYRELLPTLITYYYSDDSKFDINFLKMEIGLRFGYTLIVGECADGKIRLIGFTQNYLNTNENNFFYNFGEPLNQKSINFFIPKKLRLKKMTQITHDLPGNFITVYNKPLTFTNDFQIVGHYVEELAEIVCSRFSISMQMKITSFFKGEKNSVDINKLVTALYNGAPYVNTSKFFDPTDNIVTLDNTGATNNMTELKREYQNRISELNNMLGIDTTGVEKNSGVSSEEVNSNNGYVSSNANIYIESRKQSFDLLNRQYNLDIRPIFNDSVASQLRLQDFFKEAGEKVENNNDTDGLLSK